mgnify:CR=1 FL=1
MVNQPDKKDLIIQSVVGQRNNAMNALGELEAELQLMHQKILELEAEIEILKKEK